MQYQIKGTHISNVVIGQVVFYGGVVCAVVDTSKLFPMLALRNMETGQIKNYTHNYCYVVDYDVPQASQDEDEGDEELLDEW